MSQEKRVLNKARITLKNGYADIQLSYGVTDDKHVFYMDITGEKENGNIGSYVNLHNPIIVDVSLFAFFANHIDVHDADALAQLKDITKAFNDTVMNMPEMRMAQAINAKFDELADAATSDKPLAEVFAGINTLGGTA